MACGPSLPPLPRYRGPVALSTPTGDDVRFGPYATRQPQNIHQPIRWGQAGEQQRESAGLSIENNQGWSQLGYTGADMNGVNPTRFTWALALLLALSLGACEERKSPETQGPTVEEEAHDKIADFLHSGWEFKLGQTIQEVTDNLGEPLSEKIEKYENRHVVGQIDEIRTLMYNGLVLVVYRVNEKKPRDLFMSLAITRDNFDMKWGLKVGVSQDRVRTILGEPHKSQGGAFVYQDENSSVSFSFQGGTVRGIKWHWYVD